MLKVDKSLLQFGSVGEDRVSLGMIPSPVPDESATPFVNVVLKCEGSFYLVLLDYDIRPDRPEKSRCSRAGEEPTKFRPVLRVSFLVVVYVDTSAETLSEFENCVGARHADEQIHVVVCFTDYVRGDGALTIEESGSVDYQRVHNDPSMLQGIQHALEYTLG